MVEQVHHCMPKALCSTPDTKTRRSQNTCKTMCGRDLGLLSALFQALSWDWGWRVGEEKLYLGGGGGGVDR